MAFEAAVMNDDKHPERHALGAKVKAVAKLRVQSKGAFHDC